MSEVTLNVKCAEIQRLAQFYRALQIITESLKIEKVDDQITFTGPSDAIRQLIRESKKVTVVGLGEVENIFALSNFCMSFTPGLEPFRIGDFCMLLSILSTLSPLQPERIRKTWEDYYYRQISMLSWCNSVAEVWLKYEGLSFQHRGVTTVHSNGYTVEILHDTPKIRSSVLKEISKLEVDETLTEQAAVGLLVVNEDFKGELLPLIGTRLVLVNGDSSSVIIPKERKELKTSERDIFTQYTPDEMTLLETWSVIDTKPGLASLLDLYLHVVRCQCRKKTPFHPLTREELKFDGTTINKLIQGPGRVFFYGIEPKPYPELSISEDLLSMAIYVADVLILSIAKDDEGYTTKIAIFLTTLQSEDTLFSSFGKRKLNLGYPMKFEYLNQRIVDVLTYFKKQSDPFTTPKILFEQLMK